MAHSRKRYAAEISQNLDAPIKRAKPMTKHSAWFVTINTNVSFQPGDPKLKQFSNCFAETLNELLEDPEEFQGILNINKRVVCRDIDFSLSKFDLELAPTNGYLHAHGLIKICHRSNLQLGYKKFREHIFKELNRKLRKAGLPEAKNLYLKCEPLVELAASLNDEMRIRAYIEKNRKSMTPDEKGVYVSSKPGSKKNEYVSYKPQVVEQEQEEDNDWDIDSSLANEQTSKNMKMLENDWSDDEDSFGEDFPDEVSEGTPPPVVISPLKIPRPEGKVKHSVLRLDL